MPAEQAPRHIIMIRLAHLTLMVAFIYPVTVAVSRPEDATSWRKYYDEIFGPNRDDLPVLSERQLMRSLMSLQIAARDSVSIDPDARSKIVFWFDKVFSFNPTDNNVEDCNSDYLQRIAEEYRRHNTGNNPNLEQLYLTFRTNIIEFCESEFEALLAENAARVDSGKLIDLLNTYSTIGAAHDTDMADALVGPVLKLIDVSRKASAAEISSAWKSGPCGIVLSTMTRPDMTHYSKFIDMCKFDSSDHHWHCSESLKRWIEVVEMCKDIDTLMPILIKDIQAKRPQDSNSWKKVFDQCFGPDPDALVIMMSETKLLLSLMYLHANADRSASIDEDDKRIVNFWYDRLINFEIEDCSTDSVQRVTSDYKQRMQENYNFIRLYRMFRRNLIEFCDRHLADLPSKFFIDLSGDHLRFLRATMPENQHQDFASSSRIIVDEEIAESITLSLIEMVEGGARGEVVMYAWDNGPCGIILDSLRDPHMQQYSDFIQLSLMDNRTYLTHCSMANQIWIRTVDICTSLDNWIPAYCEDSTLAPDLRKTIKSSVRHNTNTIAEPQKKVKFHFR